MEEYIAGGEISSIGKDRGRGGGVAREEGFRGGMVGRSLASPHDPVRKMYRDVYAAEDVIVCSGISGIVRSEERALPCCSIPPLE